MITIFCKYRGTVEIQAGQTIIKLSGRTTQEDRQLLFNAGWNLTEETDVEMWWRNNHE